MLTVFFSHLCQRPGLVCDVCDGEAGECGGGVRI